MRFESQNSGICSCTHCYHSTGPEEAYSASESILEAVSETVMCGDCMKEYTCRCHLSCDPDEPVREIHRNCEVGYCNTCNEEWVSERIAEVDALDAINPKHYTRLTPEPIEVIEAWNLPYHDATALKYLSRHRQKGGAEDIKKAIWFMERILETEYGVAASGR